MCQKSCYTQVASDNKENYISCTCAVKFSLLSEATCV